MTTVEQSAARIQVRKDWGRDLLHHEPNPGLKKVLEEEHRKQLARIAAHNAQKAEARAKGQPMQGEGGSLLKVQQFHDEQARRRRQLGAYRIEGGEIGVRSWATWDEEHRPYGKQHYIKIGDHEAAEAWARGAHEVQQEHGFSHALTGKSISDKEHRKEARKAAVKSFTVRGGSKRSRQLTQAYHEGRAHAHHDLANSEHTAKLGILGMAGAFRVEQSFASLRADPSHDAASTMVSLDLPLGTIEPVPGGLPASQHHITVVYAGKTDPATFKKVLAASQDVAAKHAPLHGMVSGLGSFEPSESSDGLTPYFTVPNIEGIEKLRNGLEQFDGSSFSDYKPHVTLTYAEKGESPPAPVPPTPVTFKHLSVHRGGKLMAKIPFTGIRVEQSCVLAMYEGGLDARDWAKWDEEHPWHKFVEDLRSRHPETKIDVVHHGSHVSVDRIVVPKDARNNGTGASIMRDVLDKADGEGMPVTLTPSGDFGGSKTRLNSWYRGLGFQPNRGKLMESTDSMVRLPNGGKRDWAKWNLEHPYIHHPRPKHPGHETEHHSHRPTVMQSSVDAKQIPEIPRVPKGEKSSMADQIEVYRKEAQEISAHQYKVGSSRGQHFEEGYIAARLHANREKMEPTSAHALAAEHMDVTTSLQANQARAKREGVAAGYRAHADAKGQPEHVAPVTSGHTGILAFDPETMEKVKARDLKPGDLVAKHQDRKVYPAGAVTPKDFKPTSQTEKGYIAEHNAATYGGKPTFQRVKSVEISKTGHTIHLEGGDRPRMGGGNANVYARLKVATPAPEKTPEPEAPNHEQMGYDAARTGAMRVVPRSILVDHGTDAAKAWYTGYDRRRSEEAEEGLKPTLGPEETPADKSKYLKGSPKYNAFNEGHAQATAEIAKTPSKSPEDALSTSKLHMGAADMAGPSVEAAKSQGAAQAYMDHAADLMKKPKPPPEPEPPAHKVGPGDSVIGEKALPGGTAHLDVKTGLTYRYHEFNNGYDDHSILVQAVDKDGKVVGHVNAHPRYGQGNVNGPVVSVWKYATAEGQRRKGISRQMIETIHQENPDAKILHSGFVSDEGEKFAESMNPRYNLVKTDKDKGFRKPKGIIEPSLPADTEVNKEHHIVGSPNVGSHITHPALGGGTITSVSSKEATVDFGSNGHKRFGVSFDKGATRFEEGAAPEHVIDTKPKPIPFVIDHSLDGTGKPNEHVNLSTSTKRGYNLEVGDRLADQDTAIKTIEPGTGRGFTKLTMEDGKTVQVKRTNSVTVYPRSMLGLGSGEMLPALPSEKLIEDVKPGDVINRRYSLGSGPVEDHIGTVKKVTASGRGRRREFRVEYEGDMMPSTHYKGDEITVMPPEGALRPATPADKTDLEPGSREFKGFNSGHAKVLASHESQPYTPASAAHALNTTQNDLEGTPKPGADGHDYYASRRGGLKGELAALNELVAGQHGSLEERSVADLRDGDKVGKNAYGNDITVKDLPANDPDPDHSRTFTLSSLDNEGKTIETAHRMNGTASVALLPRAHQEQRMRNIQTDARMKKQAEDKAQREAMAAGAPSVPITEAQRVEGRRQLAQILLRSKTQQTQRDTYNSDEEYQRRGYATPGEAADEAMARMKGYETPWSQGTDWTAEMRKALMESHDVDEFRSKAPDIEKPITSDGRPVGSSVPPARRRLLAAAEKHLDAAQRHDANAESAKANNEVIDKLAEAIATGGPSPAGIGGMMSDDNIANMRRQVELKLNGDEDPTADLLGLRPNDFARHAAVMEKGDEIAARIDARPDVKAALAEELETRGYRANLPPAIRFKPDETDEESQARRERDTLRAEAQKKRQQIVANAKKVLHDATMEELMKEPAYDRDGREEAIEGHKIIGTSKAVEDLARTQIRHYPTQWIRNSALGRTLTVRETKGRAHYQEASKSTQALEKKGATGVVATVTSGKTEKSVALHELGHRMEDTNNELGALEAAHIETRAVGEAARHLGSGYGRGEGSKFDQFMAPYAGKLYSGETRRFHEVFTMGMQSVLGEDESTPTYGRLVGLDGAKADPRLRAFVLGALALHANPKVQPAALP